MKIILEGGNDSDLHNGPEKNSDEVEDSKDTKNDNEISTTSAENESPSSIVEKELRRQGISLNDLVSDNPRLSLDWRPFRGVTQCTCASPIDTLTRKVSFHKCIQHQLTIGIFLTYFVTLRKRFILILCA